MALRADQVLMIGVGLLGAYAVYRMIQTPKALAAPEPGRPVRVPSGPQPTPGVLPERPSALPLPPVALPVISGDPIHLTNSRAYGGRLETVGVDGSMRPSPFSADSSRDEIEAGLRGLGFDAVRVYMTPQEAVAAFQGYVLSSPGRGTRWFYGRYLGPTRDVARPKALAVLWITSGMARPDIPSMMGAPLGPLGAWS